MKESEKIEKYLDLAWELKRLCNMKVMDIPIVIGALRTLTKGMEKRQRSEEESRPSRPQHF